MLQKRRQVVVPTAARCVDAAALVPALESPYLVMACGTEIAHERAVVSQVQRLRLGRVVVGGFDQVERLVDERGVLAKSRCPDSR